ncbi:MAG: ABC transporter permease [Planctomycetes bacterium]|nr:ABC transporter permease [Planctomycetota bacterium]
MKKKRTPVINKAAVFKTLIAIMPFLFACLLWELAARNSSRFAFLFGSPTLVLKYLFNYICYDNGVSDILITASEAFSGFIVGNILGICLGLGLAFFPRIERITRVYIIMFGAIPIFALAPVTIMWFGIQFLLKFMIAMLSTIFVATEHAYTGAIQSDPELIMLLNSFGASKKQVFSKVIFPSSINSVATSFRITVGLSLVGAFIGEFISAEKGLGYQILKSSGLFNIPGVIGGVLLIALLAIFMRAILFVIMRAVIPWHYESKKPFQV